MGSRRRTQAVKNLRERFEKGESLSLKELISVIVSYGWRMSSSKKEGREEEYRRARELHARAIKERNDKKAWQARADYGEKA